MKVFKSNHVFILVTISLLVGLFQILPVLANEEDQTNDPNVVRGFISSVGRDHVQINTTRYRLFPNTRYINEEGGLLIKGKKQMKTDMKVDLLMEEGVIIQITLYGLLRR